MLTDPYCWAKLNSRHIKINISDVTCQNQAFAAETRC